MRPASEPPSPALSHLPARGWPAACGGGTARPCTHARLTRQSLARAGTKERRKAKREHEAQGSTASGVRRATPPCAAAAAERTAVVVALVRSVARPVARNAAAGGRAAVPAADVVCNGLAAAAGTGARLRGLQIQAVRLAGRGRVDGATGHLLGHHAHASAARVGHRGLAPLKVRTGAKHGVVWRVKGRGKQGGESRESRRELPWRNGGTARASPDVRGRLERRVV